jgi:hypothetical protein
VAVAVVQVKMLELIAVALVVQAAAVLVVQ